jgi:integrase
MRRPVFQRSWTRALQLLGWRTERDPDTDDVLSSHPLSGLVFHELRHTAAALAIPQGAHPLAIKERLGHSSITTTLDTYCGLFPSLDEAIAIALDGVLSESLSGPGPGRAQACRIGDAS